MLGPLEARIDGASVPLGKGKQRALVGLLLLHANDVVPLDVLIDEVWDGKPPRTAAAYVQNCVYRLRKVIGAGTLETRAPGYRLRVDPDSIDARRFERLVREARPLPARERAAALRAALELWRGSPLSDLAYRSFAQDVIRNLEELRVNAVQMRLEAELELGLHREVIGELDGLVREHPTHERLRWLQMLALHRSARRLDALAAYQEVRLAIVEESGMEPGEELRALQRRILQDDPTLMPGGVAAEVAERPAPLARKVVAVCIVELLVDDDLDVEAARGLVSRGLASLEEIVLRHGGTVEQLLGEEAVAVFGLPAAHEDDVLRALRSAMELRDALGSLPVRAAVETGEVLVGEDGRVLSGGALTTARRVKESAGDGDILLGPAAAAQSAGAARTEPSGVGHRLVELVVGAPAIARRPDAPLVGRRSELERLVVAVRETAVSSSCRRIVVLGEPGIGKTRLAAELVRTLEGEARALTGRCVPYAEGATFRPLAEIVEQIADGEKIGPALHGLLDGEQDGEQAATRLVDALSGTAAVDSGDVFWATRKLLETLARNRALLVVLEDVHWAEPTFLDLLEYLVGWSTDASIALVCLARTELLDARPAWTSDTIALRPLTTEETEDMLQTLPEALALNGDARVAVAAAADGNPLFLEQLAAHALDGPLEQGRLPASLESLLASRLDALPPRERSVLERAAIVGREFTRSAVDALSPDKGHGSATALLALVRRRLVRPDAARAGEDAFLFDHALVRDATYAAVAKTERARLHEQLARWLERGGELDEIVGYHLEQATLNHRDAGGEPESLARDAALRLGRAGRRALFSLDHRAAHGLLSRAVALLPSTDPVRMELECCLGETLKSLSHNAPAMDLLSDVAERARVVGDRRIELRSRVEQVSPQLLDGSVTASAAGDLLDEAIASLDRAGDAYGVARAEYTYTLLLGDFGSHSDAALEHLVRAEQVFRELGLPEKTALPAVAYAVGGATPVADALALCRATMNRRRANRFEMAYLYDLLAVLLALDDDLDGAREAGCHARQALVEVGDDVVANTSAALTLGSVEVLAENWSAAEEIFQGALDFSAQRSFFRAWRGYFLAWLGEVALGRADVDTAVQRAEEARLLSPEVDVHAAVLWRRVAARGLAARGDFRHALRLAEEAVALADSGDGLVVRGGARVDRAEVLLRAGDRARAAATLEEGLALLDRKGAKLPAARARKRLGELSEADVGEAWNSPSPAESRFNG